MNKEVIIKAVKGQIEALIHEINVLNGEYGALKIELKKLMGEAEREESRKKHRYNGTPSKDILEELLRWDEGEKISKKALVDKVPHIHHSVVGATLVSLRKKGILKKIGRGEKNSIIYVLDRELAKEYLGVDE